MVKKLSSEAKSKKPEKRREQTTNLLARVPGAHAFLSHDGKVFTDMKELAEGLAAMSDETYAYHVNSERNDFSSWVRDVIKDEQMASDLARVATRLEAVGCVTSRLAFLRGGLYE